MGEVLRRTVSKEGHNFVIGRPSPNSSFKQQKQQQQQQQQEDSLMRVHSDDDSNGISSNNNNLKGNHHSNKNNIAKWKIVVAGQFLSFLLACSGAAQATLHLDCHLTAPTFTVGLFYLGLVVCCLVPLYIQQQQQSYTHEYSIANVVIVPPEQETNDNDTRIDSATGTTLQAPTARTTTAATNYKFLCFYLHAPWYAYAGMAVLDVYANYFTVLAFRYTTITSVTLLDAFAIPTSMLISRIVLKRHYTRTHFLGVALCLTGISVNVLHDLDEKDNPDDREYPHKLVGDCLAILGGVLFGCNNVLGEVAVQHSHDPNEYIGLQSLFAVLICAVQTALTERQDVAAFVGGETSKTCPLATARWLLIAFVVTNVLGYMGGGRFLLHSEAAFFNLSLLTGDFWSVAFQVVAEHILPAPQFFVAVVLTVAGVLTYELAAPLPEKDDHRVLVVGAVQSSAHDDLDENDGGLGFELAPTTPQNETTNGNGLFV